MKEQAELGQSILISIKEEIAQQTVGETSHRDSCDDCDWHDSGTGN